MAPSSILALWNDQTLPLNEVSISPLDRAFVFGDGVYEVVSVYGGRPFLLSEHLARLEHSLEAVEIGPIGDMRAKIFENIKANNISEGMVYIQISRGTTPRAHSYYGLNLSPNLLMYSKPFVEGPFVQEARTGIKAITLEDYRWGRCDIKSLNLLANCMAQTKAHKLGATEALFLRDKLGLTEGTSSNVFVVKNDIILTPALSNYMLPGIRRNFLVKALPKLGHTLEERRISGEELAEADEIFITSSLREALAVIELDGQPVGNGLIGPIAQVARKALLDAISAHLSSGADSPNDEKCSSN